MPLDAAAIARSFLASGSLPLSRSISQVQTMLSRADYNACDLAEYLRLDPTLAARVMSVANSSFFSRQPCDTIDVAVNRLGSVQLTRIFAQVLASAAVINPLHAYGLRSDAIWRRSVMAAVGAEMAAGRKGEDRSAAYMVGLLHLMGMLVIDSFWTKQKGAAKLKLTDFEQEWAVDEKLLCGFDHATLGAEMLRELAFPLSVYGMVGQQYHKPVEPLACALYIGRLVRSSVCDTLTIKPNQELLQEYNLKTDSQLETFVSDVREEAQSMLQAA